MNERLVLPQPVKYVISSITSAGGEAWLVGGALRDIILKRNVSDFDIATSLKPNETEKLFKDYKTFNTGKRFGTITVVVDNLHMEITTFRGEKGYSDYRHPDSVEFISSIKDDLARRDFTMNAIAYNPVTYTLLDPFDGVKSINNRSIKTVNNPYERFNEDPLRMIRAIRFSSQLGFDIEPETYNAIKKLSFLINKVSVERIRDEIFKILLSPEVDNGILHLNNAGILSTIIKNSLKNRIIRGISGSENNHETNLTNAGSCSFIRKCPNDIAIRISALFLYVFDMFISDSAEIPGLNTIDSVESLLRYLRCDNLFIKRSLKLINAFNFLRYIKPTPYYIRKLTGITGKGDIYMLIDWYKAYSRFLEEAHGIKPVITDFVTIYSTIENILKNNDPICRQELTIDGHDVKKLGIGVVNKKEIGEALDTALEWVLKDPECNTRDILLDRLKAKYSNRRNDRYD